jgi:hypothetical protein
MTAKSRAHRIGLIAERVDREEIGRKLASGEQPLAAWCSWERVEMPRDMLRALLLALIALMSLIGYLLFVAPSLQIKYAASPVVRDTSRIGQENTSLAHTLSQQQGGIQHGQLLAGNSPADLGAARAAGQHFIRLRFAYNPDAVNGAFRELLAHSTPAGSRKLMASVARGGDAKTAIEQVVLGDSGIVALREFGTGAYSYGVAPGQVRVVIPLVGRLHSRHFPYDGALSGLRVYENAIVTVRRGPGAEWRFDDLQGGELDSTLVATWRQYHFATRPRPSIVIDGVVVPPDSVWIRSVARGMSYRNQH